MMKHNVPKRVTLPNGRILLLIIREYLKENCHLILLCIELMRKELCQEVEDVDKEVAEFLILLKKSPEIRSLNHLQKKVSNMLREFIIT